MYIYMFEVPGPDPGPGPGAWDSGRGPGPEPETGTRAGARDLRPGPGTRASTILFVKNVNCAKKESSSQPHIFCEIL